MLKMKKKIVNKIDELFTIIVVLLLIIGLGSAVFPSYTVGFVNPPLERVNNIELPFDMVTLSLLLAGFLIVGGSWNKGNKKLFKIGKNYIYSAVFWVLFYSFTPFIVPNATYNIVKIIYYLSGIIGLSIFIQSTVELIKFLRSNA